MKNKLILLKQSTSFMANTWNTSSLAQSVWRVWLYLWTHTCTVNVFISTVYCDHAGRCPLSSPNIWPRLIAVWHHRLYSQSCFVAEQLNSIRCSENFMMMDSSILLWRVKHWWERSSPLRRQMSVLSSHMLFVEELILKWLVIFTHSLWCCYFLSSYKSNSKFNDFH